MTKFIILCGDNQQGIERYSNIKDSNVATSIMEDEGFINYTSKHGYHFSDKLAEYASSLMKNEDGTIHSWKSMDVLNALNSLGLTDMNTSTVGDLTYLANMAYADFYPEVLKTETACIKYAYAVAHDKDGYDGIAFSRWLADIINKHITDIKWDKYI